MPQRSASQYMLLTANLLGRIQSGEFKVGDLLPTEQELCEQFDVSRITVRSALRELELQGLVDRRPGIGTRVQAAAAQRPATFAELGDTVDDVLQFTRGIPLKVISREEITVDPALAQDLGLPEGRRYVRLEAVRQRAKAPPMVYSRHYLPSLQAPPASALRQVRVSLAQWLADHQGDEIMGIDQQFNAVAVTAEEAQHLQCPEGAPALRSTRWYYGHSKRPFLVSVSVFPGDRYAFRSRLRRGGNRTPRAEKS